MTSAFSLTPARERDEYQTPDWLFNWAEARWGPYQVDLAATPENTKKELYIPRGMNSLAQPWHEWGTYGWLNPPYSNLTPWIRKAVLEAMEHNFHTTMLLPAPAGAEWTQELNSATELIFIVGRISFIRPNGVVAKGNTGGSVFAIFNPGRLGPPSVLFLGRDFIKKVGTRGTPLS